MIIYMFICINSLTRNITWLEENKIKNSGKLNSEVILCIALGLMPFIINLKAF